MPKVEPARSGLHHESLRLKGEESPINVYGGYVATAAANEILCEILTAIKCGPDDANAVRVLSRLVFTHTWVLRVAELHEYLNWLVRKRRDAAVRRIINDPQHPGRRHESKVFLVHLMRATIADEACTADRAALLVEKRYGKELGNLSASAIKSDYSRYKHEYDRLRAGQFIGARWLATTKWRPQP
ncbi:MAG: hypothetical protein AB7T06_10825 [Kofleriaceae bacterium]